LVGPGAPSNNTTAANCFGTEA
jgi:hypothetical protein